MNALMAALLILIAISALGVVFSPQTIYSALSLVLTVGLLAAIFLVLNAQFLFAVQLIVYAGAVMVLFVFIIALHDPASEERPRLADPRLILGVLAIAGICTAVFIAARNGITYATSCTTQAASCMHGYTVGSLAASGAAGADPYNTFGFPQNGVDQAGNVQVLANQLSTPTCCPSRSPRCCSWWRRSAPSTSPAGPGPGSAGIRGSRRAGATT